MHLLLPDTSFSVEICTKINLNISSYCTLPERTQRKHYLKPRSEELKMPNEKQFTHTKVVSDGQEF